MYTPSTLAPQIHAAVAWGAAAAVALRRPPIGATAVGAAGKGFAEVGVAALGRPAMGRGAHVRREGGHFRPGTARLLFFFFRCSVISISGETTLSVSFSI